MSAVVLDRHELLWVLEQCGASWPYPLRPVHWSADTDAEVTRHRTAVEEALRARGLLEPGPARLLLDVGRTVAGWVLAVDLVRREATVPRAAVALTDGHTGALLDSPEHARAPVRVARCAPDALGEALMSLVPPAPAGQGPALPVVVPGSGAEDLPMTTRAAGVREAAESVLAGVTAVTQVGVARRRGGEPWRVATPLCWIDGPRGRHAVRPPLRPAAPTATPTAAPKPTLLVPATAGQLLADLRSVLGAALAPPPPGRSTA